MLNHEYEVYHFSEIIADNSVGFNYTLNAGKLMNRNAISIHQINETILKS